MEPKNSQSDAQDLRSRETPPRSGREFQGTRPPEAHAKRFTTSESFCPPKPKLFERQISTFAARAVLGT